MAMPGFSGFSFVVGMLDSERIEFFCSSCERWSATYTDPTLFVARLSVHASKHLEAIREGRPSTAQLDPAVD